MNVIESISVNVKTLVITKTNDILKDIHKYLLFEMVDEINAGREILEITKSFWRFIDEIKRKDYSRFLYTFLQ